MMNLNTSMFYHSRFYPGRFDIRCYMIMILINYYRKHMEGGYLGGTLTNIAVITVGFLIHRHLLYTNIINILHTSFLNGMR